MSSNAPYVLAQKEKLLHGGSKAAVDAQHSAGKQTARERVNAIIDDGTFLEIDTFASSKANEFTAEVPCEGLVAGFGTIQGRPVYIYSQDYTVLSGSVGKVNGEKICKIMNLAADNGVPVIGILDSGGARVGEGVDSLDAFAKIFSTASSIKGVVPQISMVLGPCYGACAIAAKISDITLGVAEISSMGAHSTYVYDAVEGKESGTDICSAPYCAGKSGLLDLVYENEKASIAGLKALLGYLPSSAYDTAAGECTDDLNRSIPDFATLADAPYDVRSVISGIADNNVVFELAPDFSSSMVTSLIKINGKTIGVVANQAMVNDTLNLTGIKKATDFIDKCDMLGIPLLTLVDNKGISTDTNDELNGIVTESAALAQVYANSSVPKVALILGSAIGSGYALMAAKSLGTDMVYAWAGAKISPMGSEASAQVVYGKEIVESENPAATRQEYVAKFEKYNANPINAARSGLIDDIIDPVDTRPTLVAAFEMLGFSNSYNY